MRSENGKHFENVVGVTDRNPVTGDEFEASVLNCNKPMAVGDTIPVGGKEIQYRGEDSMGHSIFIAAGRPIT